MRKVVAILWIALLLGALAVVPKVAKAEDTTDGKYDWYRFFGGSRIEKILPLPNGDIMLIGYTGRTNGGDALVALLDSNGNIKWKKTYGGNEADYAHDAALTPEGNIIIVGGAHSFTNNKVADGWIFEIDPNGNVKWQKTYGGSGSDYASAVAIAPNGDVIVAGGTYSFGDSRDVWVLRLDSEGNVKWQKTYGGSEYDRAYAVAIAPNGDVIVAGFTESFGAGKTDVWVLRLDANGNVKWQKTYGRINLEEAYAVAIAENGDVIVAGWTNSFGAGEEDVWVLRLDANGNVKWQKTFGGSDDDWAEAVAIAENGDVIVAGETDSFGAGYDDVWVLRLDSEGNVKWQKTYGGSDYDVARAVAIAENGDVIVAGYTKSFGAGGRDFWVLRLDENGNVKWQKTYGGSEYDRAYAVAIAPNGDVIVAGETESFGAGSDDVWVLRLDENGNVKWQKTYGGSDWEWAYAVAIAPNGDVIVAGFTESFGDSRDVWVLRLDGNGNVKWQKTYGGSGSDYAFAVAIAENGDIIVGGNFLLCLDSDGNVKWAKNLHSSDVVITPNGDILTSNGYLLTPNGDSVWDTYFIGRLAISKDGQVFGASGGRVLSFNLDNPPIIKENPEVEDITPEVSTTNAEVHVSNANITLTDAIITNAPTLPLETPTPTNAEVQESNATPQDSNAIIQNTNAEVHEIKEEHNTETPAPAKEVTSTLINTGTIEISGYQPSTEYLKNVSAYAIQKAEELIGKVKDLGYEINFADDYLGEAKKAFDAGDYKKAKELALNAWITALLEWQIQYEAGILEKAGVDVSQVMGKYNSGDLDGAINLIHSLENELSGDYAGVFDSVDNTFEVIKDYWKNGIRLWNYVGDLYASNEKFKGDELDVAKNLADKALNVVRDVGEMAREVLRQLKELGDSIFNEGRGDEKAKELFERAMELFERGEFEEAKQVVVEIQEVITVTTTKSGGICGPALILGLMIIPILIRRRMG